MSHDASSPNRLIWKDFLVVGLPDIDEQHMLLCTLANRLLDRPEASGRDERVVDILTDLGKFLILHFQSEEAIMRQLGMRQEEYEQHVRDHNRIIEDYANLNLAAARGKHYTAAEVFAIVKQWVSDHFHTHDVKIRNYLPAPSPD